MMASVLIQVYVLSGLNGCCHLKDLNKLKKQLAEALMTQAVYLLATDFISFVLMSFSRMKILYFS